MKKAALILVCLLSAAPLTAGDAYAIDGGHSGVMFSVSHNEIGVFYGRFNKFDGSINYDEANPSASSISITIDMASVDTNSGKRDDHLRSNDFFSVKQFPEASFKSTKVEQKGDVLHFHGDFTMTGKTHPAVFEVKITKAIQNRRGQTLRGLQAEGVIKRSEHGMSYGLGGIGDEVTIIASLEIVAQ